MTTVNKHAHLLSPVDNSGVLDASGEDLPQAVTLPPQAGFAAVGRAFQLLESHEPGYFSRFGDLLLCASDPPESEHHRQMMLAQLEAALADAPHDLLRGAFYLAMINLSRAPTSALACSEASLVALSRAGVPQAELSRVSRVLAA